MNDCQHPPASLPANVIAILAEALSCQTVSIEGLWATLKAEIWQHPEVTLQADEVDRFNKIALKFETYITSNAPRGCSKWVLHLLPPPHKAEHARVLVLPHGADSQMARIKPALHERNKETEGTGQENYAHACKQCFIITENDKGERFKLHAALCDGNSIGHRCCRVHDCQEPLPTTSHRFCVKHTLEVGWQCSVKDCTTASSKEHWTCELPEHRAKETQYFEQGKALFQLQARLRRAGMVSDTDALSTVLDVEEDSRCDGKSPTGNQLRALFNQGRTHNGQLIVRPCGVVISRATFFGSEAVSSVHEFGKAMFPTPESTPEYFVFDNNCKLQAHINTIGDQHFANTGMPVDVFHFKSKHKVSDTFCQRHCNPAAFPELINKDNKWVINTSICEQINVWFGKFRAIIQDMEVTRYNFFLDEMIKRHNRHIIEELKRDKQEPWSIPIAFK
ncbi:hypothetical protein DXG01_014052 [Tephrocybe rancida]|nr:hypothetical protein DXG01_014052 [Tephrocybe rancida]